jgi:uncharacterized protein with von Willebrand factor type A (vWA) domain
VGRRRSDDLAAKPVSHLLTNLLVFGRLLRGLGVQLHTGRLLDAAQALQLLDLGSREDVRHTCRALLVHRREDLPLFDRAFNAFWRLHEQGALPRTGQPPIEDRRPETPLRERGPEPTAGLEIALAAGADNEDDPSRAVGAWSDTGSLANKDFAELTPQELDAARSALLRLVWHPGERRTRRWVAGRGARLDVRRARARSLRTGGDLAVLPRLRRRRRTRPLVLICDVSGSMEHYSRMLLHFAHVVGQRHRKVEVFLFSTHLSHVTPQIRARGPDRALAAVAQSVHDWSGGTRTGDALRQLHQQWRRRVLYGGPVVLLISDGWDRGDPDVLRDQVARLQRSCFRLIWLNPLIGTAGYAPLTRGLQAALPFVDDFLPARTLTNLVDLALHLNSLTAPTRMAR